MLNWALIGERGRFKSPNLENCVNITFFGGFSPDVGDSMAALQRLDDA